MKTTLKRMTALFLVLLMTASLLASCSGGGEKETTVIDVEGIPVYENYKSQKIDLGLAENETVFDIIEIIVIFIVVVGAFVVVEIVLQLGF